MGLCELSRSGTANVAEVEGRIRKERGVLPLLTCLLRKRLKPVQLSRLERADKSLSTPDTTSAALLVQHRQAQDMAATLAAMIFVLLCCLMCCDADLVPAITPIGVQTIRGPENDGHYYRDLFLDAATDTLYVGARSYLYKIKLDSTNATVISKPLGNTLDADNTVRFNDLTATDKVSWKSSLSDYSPFVSLLQQYNVSATTDRTVFNRYINGLDLESKLRQFLGSKSFQYSSSNYGNNILDVAEQYSSLPHSGIVGGTSYRKICQNQTQILKLFYGRSLRTRLDQGAEILCARHVRGLTWLDGGSSKLFSLATGIFGTMQVSVTGTNDYTSWVELEAMYTSFLNCMETQPSFYPWLSCADRLRAPPVTAPYTAATSAKSFTSSPSPLESRVISNLSKGFVVPSPENFIGRKRFCDPNPAPRRLIFQKDDLAMSAKDPLSATPRDTCSAFLMASSFLSGYDPDQATFTFVSASGNGKAGARAIYVLTETGQEKQLDLNLDYLNLPEIMPLTGSASLALVRLLVDPATNDIIPGSIVISNPFKYTWVTSTLTRWGKMIKSGSQEQVPHRPRAVQGMFESGDYVYFFFREVEWEQLPLPEYSISRHHYQLNSYGRSLYYPWEAGYASASRSEPYVKQEEEPGQTREELYAPPLLGWRQSRSQSAMTGRVGRVCKNDEGLPLGVQDASVFNLDPGLSLSAFQSFVKAKLSCRVPVPATPQVWRFRKDLSRSNDTGPCDSVLMQASELYGKDLHYRAVSRDESVTIRFRTSTQGPTEEYGKYYYLSHCRGYKWGYLPKPVMMSAAYVEYNELRDVYQVGSTFYGVFTSALSEEQLAVNRTDSQHEAMLGSAVCTFTLDDITGAFSGPFKKRINNAWRPYDPRIERRSISPSPYSCVNDPVLSEAQKIQSMTIEFLDPSQPLTEELRKFDLRRNSSRLNFFEEDVQGSRTMWNAVNTTAVMSRAGVVFDKILADKVADYTVLFISTGAGEIYKVATWQPQQSCFTTPTSDMSSWLNSPFMHDVWNNDLYPLYNRTVVGAEGRVSFASDISTEKGLRFPDDFLFSSDWDCSPPVRSRVLAIMKPFREEKRRIWSMKLHKGVLLLGTDKDVLRLPVYEQCGQYTHCATCAADPYCSWNGTTCLQRFQANGTQANTSDPWNADPLVQCTGCQQTLVTPGFGEDVVLPGFASSSATSITSLKWFYNGSPLILQTKKLMTAENSSLIIFNYSKDLDGIYELHDEATDTCLSKYLLNLADCDSTADRTACLYKLQHAEWAKEFDNFKEKSQQWYSDYLANDFCRGQS